MVNQLQRIGLPPNSSLEQKRLSLDLAGIIIAWEKRRRSASVAKPTVSCGCTPVAKAGRDASTG
jgi:transformation/transcription domain-associated protein